MNAHLYQAMAQSHSEDLRRSSVSHRTDGQARRSFLRLPTLRRNTASDRLTFPVVRRA